MSIISPKNDLDLTYLNEVADGSDEFIIETIEMFLVQAPEILETLELAIKNQDGPTSSSYAHKLKPNLGIFGMLKSQELFREIEFTTKGEAPDFSQVASKFLAAKGTILENMIALEKIKKEKEA